MSWAVVVSVDVVLVVNGAHCGAPGPNRSSHESPWMVVVVEVGVVVKTEVVLAWAVVVASDGKPKQQN